MNDMTRLDLFDGVRPHSIGAHEFARMVAADVFDGRRVELVEGELVEMSPSNQPQGKMVARLNGLLWNAYPESDWILFADTYVGLTSSTVRAPDLSVIRRNEDPGAELSGTDVHLAIEVSHTTLAEDLGRKRRQYAEAGIRNYWVVDVEGRRVHRFAGPSGSGYLEAEVCAFGEALLLPGIDDSIIIG